MSAKESAASKDPRAEKSRYSVRRRNHRRSGGLFVVLIFALCIEPPEQWNDRQVR